MNVNEFDYTEYTLLRDTGYYDLDDEEWEAPEEYCVQELQELSTVEVEGYLRYDALAGVFMGAVRRGWPTHVTQYWRTPETDPFQDSEEEQEFVTEILETDDRTIPLDFMYRQQERDWDRYHRDWRR